MGVDNDPEAFWLSTAFHCPNVELLFWFFWHILVTSSSRKFTQIDVVEGVAETVLVKGRLEMIAISEKVKKLSQLKTHCNSIKFVKKIRI